MHSKDELLLRGVTQASPESTGRVKAVIENSYLTLTLGWWAQVAVYLANACTAGAGLMSSRILKMG
ncbi:MAG: hypothetical protein VB144_12295 [Clostridia bacterium]|nr:hypothetical protein [Clostridia bacterium]